MCPHFWTKAGRINTLIALKIQDLLDLKTTVLKGQQPDSNSGTDTENMECLTSWWAHISC